MEQHFKYESLMKYCDEKFGDIKPKTVPDDISELVPQEIWNTMTKDKQKDLQETFGCYACEFWTATLLMIYRVLEESLRVHVEYDLKEKEVKNIGEIIDILRQHDYNENFLKKLEYYKDERNSFMHGKKRASPNEAKNMLGYLMSIVLEIYNIKP
ncbi:MAG: hypothetical protein Ta2F_14270 [Termitinemataceae bacterium]|nr:MAG: hypothetical protein Ta2F_14270 [Termitinemataceae bacterium]